MGLPVCHAVSKRLGDDSGGFLHTLAPLSTVFCLNVSLENQSAGIIHTIKTQLIIHIKGQITQVA
jgi:hypothetical protein